MIVTARLIAWSVAAVLVVGVSAHALGRSNGWHAHEKLANAQRAEELADQARRTAEAQLDLTRAGAALAQKTITTNQRARAAEAVGVQEIRDAARREDFDALNAAIVAAAERVWNDAPATPSGGGVDRRAPGAPSGLPGALVA